MSERVTREPMNRECPVPLGHSLDALSAHVPRLQMVPKSVLRPGDRLIIRTRNSTYVLVAECDGRCLVSGGWFDRRGISPARVHINGCTWGGCIIKADIVAACGLCLEFGNRVTTSPIEEIVVIPWETQN